MTLKKQERSMLGSLGKLRLGVACTAAAAVLVLSAGIGAIYAAEQPTAEQIINALKPKAGLTRSLSGSAAAARSPEDQQFVDGLRTKRTRSLSVSERERVATIVKEQPSIDLEINFDYNSANIAKKAVPAVTNLGKALSDPELKASTFLVAGHTDAKGGDDYNQQLSERRAQAIKRYLVEKFGIQAENLVTVGYGKGQIKNKEQPFSEENRRVQVVNMAR
jgi:outer membrane protein OmpA-like peptidoglycan-associated protein